MSVRIVNVDPTRATRTIAATGQEVEFGDEVEIEDSELAAALLEQETVWARPTTKAARQAAPRRARVAKKAAPAAEPASAPESANEPTSEEE